MSVESDSDEDILTSQPPKESRKPASRTARTKASTTTTTKSRSKRLSGGPAPRKATTTKSNKRAPSPDPHGVEDAAENTVAEVEEVQSKLARSKAATSSRPKPTRKEPVIEEPQEVEAEAEAMEMDEPRQPNTTRQPATASDSKLRRQLDQATQKLESMELRYKTLKEIGVTEAQSNYDKLKKQTEEKNMAADALIASLKKDLAAQAAAVDEITTLREQQAATSTKVETLQRENSDLQKQLASAQAETKLLHAKLTATRAGSTESRPAVKNGAAIRPAGADAHKQRLKEELFGDLTGLVINDVTRNDDEGEDQFDCWQTGRNGTLRFKLSVPNPTVRPADFSAEDAEFSYDPILDASNDRNLIAILPDYLQEGICFPRSNAAKFYARVGKFMDQPVEAVDEVMDGGQR